MPLSSSTAALHHSVSDAENGFGGASSRADAWHFAESGAQRSADTDRQYCTSQTTSLDNERYTLFYGTEQPRAFATAPNGAPPRWSQHGGTTHRSETFIERYLSSGFLLRIVLFLVIFFMVALAWSGLFQLIDVEKLVGEDAGALGVVSFFIGLAYFVFLQFTLDSYPTPQEQFVRLGQRLLATADELYASAPTTDVTFATPGTRVRIGALLDETACALRAMCYYTFRLFNPSGDERLALVFVECPQMREEFTQSRYGAFAAESMAVLGQMLTWRVKQLERLGSMTPGDYSAFARRYDAVQAMLEDVRTSQIVSTPQLFRDYVVTIVVVYMVGFAPISIELASDNSTTLLVIYPIIAFLVLGFLVYRDWIGLPFDDSLRVSTLNYRALYLEWMARIDKRRQYTPRLSGD